MQKAKTVVVFKFKNVLLLYFKWQISIKLVQNVLWKHMIGLDFAKWRIKKLQTRSCFLKASDVIHKSKSELFREVNTPTKFWWKKVLEKIVEKRKIKRKIKWSFELINLTFHFLVRWKCKNNNCYLKSLSFSAILKIQFFLVENSGAWRLSSLRKSFKSLQCERKENFVV